MAITGWVARVGGDALAAADRAEATANGRLGVGRPYRTRRTASDAADPVAVGDAASALPAPLDWAGTFLWSPAIDFSTLGKIGAAAAVPRFRIPAQGPALSSIRIFNIIPSADSGETDQNSEPSLAVNPLDPSQIIAGAFGDIDSNANTPFFLSINGGVTWTDFDNLDTVDKSLAWLADGSGFVMTSLVMRGFLITFTDIQTYAATPASGGFGAPIDTFMPQRIDFLDQPWVRTGPPNHVYVAYNNLNFAGTRIDTEESGAFAAAAAPPPGATASVNVSTDGGNTSTPVVIDRVGAAAGQDAPSVRLAVNGSTVYAAFTRWNTQIQDDPGELRFASDIVVVRSDDGGADEFMALGAGGVGTIVANPITSFANDVNNPLTLGQERDGGDLAIAVDPTDAGRVVIAYQSTPGPDHSGQVQLVVAESTDGGQTWTTKFTTSDATRSGQPALAIQTDGTIGFLFNNYDPLTDTLSQHLLQTDDDFVTTTDTVLAVEANSTPIAVFSPYLGDFVDLQAVDNTFYGVFSASNADNGVDAQFLADTSFQRSYTGVPGMASFQLMDGSGNSVTASIDPYFFVVSDVPCFVRGTRVATETGEVAVEDLAIGERVIAQSGSARPIKWLGRRAYDGRFVAQNRNVLPICIAAGALAGGVPARDLLVSPEHALWLDGVLVPARLLVNGVTVAGVPSVDRLEYFHIELDTHDVIFAEGVAAESFVDCANRPMFRNAAEFAALYPDDCAAPWQFCALRVEDRSAAAVLAIRARLLARAEELGRVTRDPDLHLIVDGSIVRPLSVGHGEYRFAIAAGARDVTLASRSTVPFETEAGSGDERRLGVPFVRAVLWDADVRIEIVPGCPNLRSGFHACENSHRWTDGHAALPPELLTGFAGDFRIDIQSGPTELHYPTNAPCRNPTTPALVAALAS
jgi:Hint domain